MKQNEFVKMILSKITEEQILDIIKDFGALPYRIKETEIWFKTICHGGDSHKLCYFRNSKEFYCYTNCGKMNLFSFIMSVQDCSFYEAIEFLKRKLKISTRVGLHSPSVSESEELLAINRDLEFKSETTLQDCSFVPLETIDD
jgi:hypothetical protein